MEHSFHGLRITSQRKIIYDYLQTQTFPKSAEEIFEELPPKTMDLSTIYRILDAFSKVNIVTKNFMNDRYYYHIISDEHKHFLVCLDCHETVEVDGCPFTSYEEKISSSSDFKIAHHPVEIFGYCKKCQEHHK
jgi:Fur family ferric uptake transcriptional regulator